MPANVRTSCQIGGAKCAGVLPGIPSLGAQKQMKSMEQPCSERGGCRCVRAEPN